MTTQKKMPRWGKIAVAGVVGAGAVVGGQRLSVDSPVHFKVQGMAPADAPGWKCAPEGGLIGAPLVCRPDLTSLPDDAPAADLSTATGDR